MSDENTDQQPSMPSPTEVLDNLGQLFPINRAYITTQRTSGRSDEDIHAELASITTNKDHTAAAAIFAIGVIALHATETHGDKLSQAELSFAGLTDEAQATELVSKFGDADGLLNKEALVKAQIDGHIAINGEGQIAVKEQADNGSEGSASEEDADS